MSTSAELLITQVYINISGFIVTLIHIHIYERPDLNKTNDPILIPATTRTMTCHEPQRTTTVHYDPKIHPSEIPRFRN